MSISAPGCRGSCARQGRRDCEFLPCRGSRARLRRWVCESVPLRRRVGCHAPAHVGVRIIRRCRGSRGRKRGRRQKRQFVGFGRKAWRSRARPPNPTPPSKRGCRTTLKPAGCGAIERMMSAIQAGAGRIAPFVAATGGTARINPARAGWYSKRRGPGRYHRATSSRPGKYFFRNASCSGVMM